VKLASILVLTLAYLALRCTVALAQVGTPRLSIVEGAVFLNEQALESPAADVPLNDTAEVRTTNGRAGLELTTGDLVFIGRNASLRLLNRRGLNVSRFEILDGSIVVLSGGVGPAVVCENEVQLSDKGIFRFDVQQVDGARFCRVRVYKGAASAQMPSFTWVLTPGKSLDLALRCGDHIPRNEFDTEELDELDHWSRAQPPGGGSSPLTVEH